MSGPNATKTVKHDGQTQENPYMVMSIDRVRSDGLHGVSLAIEAWRTRDPAGAARELGPVIEPGHEKEQVERTRRILAAVGDYQNRTGSRLKRASRAGQQTPYRTE